MASNPFAYYRRSWRVLHTSILHHFPLTVNIMSFTTTVTAAPPPGQPDIAYAPNYENYQARTAKRLKEGNLPASVPDGFPKQLTGDLVWEGDSVGQSYDWTFKLSEEQLGEIDQALRHFKDLGLSLGHISTETFPLPKLHSELRKLSDELHKGHGFFVIRGVNVDNYTREENAIIYVGISSHIASQRGRQDSKFDGKPADVVLTHVKDLSAGQDKSVIGSPAYTTDRQVFHTDSGDIVSLFCLETALEGGASRIASTWRVYNELARTRPDLIHTLSQTWDVENFANPNKKFTTRPLLYHQKATDTLPERVALQYARRYFVGFGALPRSHDIPPISEAQAEALDALHFLGDQLSVSTNFAKGDMQFINNLAVFHARDAFTDSPTHQLLTSQERQRLKEELLATNDEFIRQIPKVEMHIHIDGMITPELRWKLAQINGLEVRMGKNKPIIKSLDDLKKAYASIISSSQRHQYEHLDPSLIPPTFFEAYYSSHDVLRKRQDFYDVAMAYFQGASEMNVRYCEVFFDPQAHTSRGVSWDDMMGGLRDAQNEAARTLNVKAAWIMCFLRDQSPDSAMEHYKAALPYRDMIIGIGLDSNEHKRPPVLFKEVFQQAKKDGFKITAHCDVGQEDTYQNIHQLISPSEGILTHRIDHGLNAADKPEPLELITSQGIGMTICPWAYLRRFNLEEIGRRMRTLIDVGVKICISSDDPPFMEGAWIMHNMLLARQLCGLSEEDVVQMMRDAVEISWAVQDVKTEILAELDRNSYRSRNKG
ncbi:family oxidoreductase [Fusarium tjaetaba]|uniref:Family oxidoreductase n=1 Tax=Fusarium tjaetaba TaxID=1567544 RepID=A0A8H5VR56_9HYPO|nr:family oxidoreductase [Fusarium tjaetaba]KAF5630169.1 family oxidoreductase [Fusarium tjaetaba]